MAEWLWNTLCLEYCEMSSFQLVAKYVTLFSCANDSIILSNFFCRRKQTSAGERRLQRGEAQQNVSDVQ